jgi:hypothetical protein
MNGPELSRGSVGTFFAARFSAVETHHCRQPKAAESEGREIRS